MWPDPADPKRKRLTHMKGTPANKASVIFSLGTITLMLGTFYALTFIPWFEARIEKNRLAALKQLADQPAKKLLHDPLIQGALFRKREEYEGPPAGYKSY